MKKQKMNKKMQGVRPHEPNINRISEKAQKIREKIEEEKQKENLQLTFHPKINDYSRKLVENKRDKKEKIEDKLMNIGKVYAKKLSLSTNEQNTKYTYKPKIPELSNNIGKTKRKKRVNILLNNKKIMKANNNLNNRECKTETNSKEKIMENKNNNISQSKNKNNNNRKENHLIKLNPNNNLFDYLYLEYKLLRQKRNKEIKKNMALICPFKPKLNKSYNKNNRNIQTNVFDRLYASKNNNLINRIRINKKINSREKNDFSMNKSNNKPAIARRTIHPRKINLSVDYKSYSKDLNESKKETIISENNIKKSNKINYMKKSNNIISNAKHMKYKELFNTLDSDRDGLITSKKIKLSSLDYQNLISLTPILNELQYKGKEMDLNQFSDYIDKK